MAGMSKFKEEYAIQAYELARAGMSDKKISKMLDVDYSIFKKWKRRHPILAEAVKRGKDVNGQLNGDGIKDYIYNRLSPELQRLWEKINACEDIPNGIRRIEELLRDQGKRARQHLFVHALIAGNFSVSEACRKVNISRKTFEKWKIFDPYFQELVDEIHWHKKNYLEGALFAKVKEGDTTAIIFANRTFNRDRGYNDKVEMSVEHKGEVSHMVSIDSLELPIEVRRQMLEAIRKKRAIEVEHKPAQIEHKQEDDDET